MPIGFAFLNSDLAKLSRTEHFAGTVWLRCNVASGQQQRAVRKNLPNAQIFHKVTHRAEVVVSARNNGI
jgi:hypothetical protein